MVPSLSDTPATDMFNKLSIHRNRIRTFDMAANTWILCGQIIYVVLLRPPTPSSLPSLSKLDIRHEEDQYYVPPQRAPMEPHILLQPIASIFPALTTLALPLVLTCIPFPDSPILTLKTLVLDGSMSWMMTAYGFITLRSFSPEPLISRYFGVKSTVWILIRTCPTSTQFIPIIGILFLCISRSS
ncbi:hypothetical protein BDN70DRAFT_871664 [Pholiota conissans]|uniref:Uncharacterized protein n=1 Tax=Pholiota conissans TaxID=109636 RepID=A0A9P5ZCN3_9AGAR|nr:hypothetical protein BDN70DRAFT_871664 [Pholiota conissans]